jgi:sigma-B regulation protein RsbU (phosphoserine phosphatase)
MIFADLLPLHRQEFEALATAWLRSGAVGVRLLEKGQVIGAYPDGYMAVSPALVVSDPDSGLELHLHGLNSAALHPGADLQLRLFGRMLRAEHEMETITASLVETQDRLVALYDLARATRRIFEFNDLLDLLTAESSRLLEANGAFAVVYLPGQAPIVRQHTQNPLPESHLLAAATLYRQDPGRHTFKDSETLPAGLRNVVMSLLPVRDQVFACLGVFNKAGQFSAPDSKLLKAITDQAGAKLDNALLYQEVILRARLDAEMNLARQVQTALLPQSLPTFEGADVHGVSIPALQVGGDFFDVAAMPGRGLLFLVGDVTGKGLPAAMLMSMTHTVARSAVRYMPFDGPHQVLERLNKDLLDDYSAVGMFTTAFVGMLDPTARKLSFANAGQSPVLYASPAHEPILLEAQDIPVGIFDQYAYSSQTLAMAPGDVLVVMTDGFNEARAENEDMFGIERLKKTLKDHMHLSAQEITAGFFKAISDFSGNHPQDDDRTLVVLKIT